MGGPLKYDSANLNKYERNLNKKVSLKYLSKSQNVLSSHKFLKKVCKFI
jgi:hypothetical protein